MPRIPFSQEAGAAAGPHLRYEHQSPRGAQDHRRGNHDGQSQLPTLTYKGLAARDRYQGPLWQTLRAADPDGVRAFVCFLSARSGLGDARDLLPRCDRVLTDADAGRMVSAATWTCYPELPQSSRMTMAAKLRVAHQHGPLRSRSGVLTRLARELGQPFRAVVICGGHRCVRVASSWLPDFRAMRQLAADAPVTSAKPEVCASVNGPIGIMRAKLRAWIMQ